VRSAQVFTLLLLASGFSNGCGGGMADQVRSAARAGEAPEDLVVTYDDYHTTWGGERLVLSADRSLEMSRWRPGDPEDAPRVVSGSISAEAFEQTLQLLVDLEAWEQRIEEDEGRLDDARARLTIAVGGDRTTIWEWRNDLEATRRIVRIKQQLEALAFDARHPMMDDPDDPMGGDEAP